jgi:aspartate 1-decarboxylase
MMRSFLRSKIHRVRVTDAQVEYSGSLTLDPHLMNAADLLPWEKVEIYNVTNGARLETFVVQGKPGSGEVRVNGAAAHLVRTGDVITIACYGAFHVGQVLNHNPKFVFVDENNRVTALKEG